MSGHKPFKNLSEKLRSTPEGRAAIEKERAMSMGYIQGLRTLIGHQKILVPGVRAVILNDQGEVLLQQRGDFGTWGLPAGAVELDESVIMALHREVWEETGLHVAQATPFAMCSDPRWSATYPNGDQVQPFSLVFLVTEWSGDPTADGQESLRLAFFGFEHLPPVEQVLPSHYKTLLDVQTFLEDGTFIVD
jgi:8-oxo-dGTP pyrophosphatase MutT (NUDIX family)